MLSIRHTRDKVEGSEENRRNSWSQIRDDISLAIISGEYNDGDTLPSVRSCAKERRAHHDTVRKAYDTLAAEGVITKRRGLSPVVACGGTDKLLLLAKSAFLGEQLPAFAAQMRLLGLTWSEVEAVDVAREGSGT
ncbi:GntR family transcriptional regulator [Altererythrobacter sp. SALINAS58]|uniref:GntR family transcriptional regulator n=1 Tax=Alteripontixanthobacter muriae TaxID=2705546 RepID=UPI0015751319|nr:GntR family transcriptional regulator [Alteripontixanthobacter muriae]